MDSKLFELTLEQEFQMKLMEQSAQGMSHDQTVDLLMQTAKLLMIKDNVIRDLVKKQVFSWE
jgi:uncharacterized membrane protein